jgi:metal-sulfur cluster biosynthetic enzyme
MITKEQVIARLETIIDPEVGIDIYTMGLVYDIQIKGDKEVYLKITYTTPMCPAGPSIQDEIRTDMRALGFEHVEIDLTFEPPWKPSKELREALGIPGE